jgi:hypothetical protein
LDASGAWSDDVDLGDATAAADEREALVEHYTNWALAEHASIASFARFSLQLLAIGAPPHLVQRATEAMADETRHARFGFGLVAALSGEAVGPAELFVDGALQGELSLERTLRLAVREGMIGETLAALEVRAAADFCAFDFLRDAINTIADEESRHAELAYAFAAWALSRAPELSHIVREEIDQWSSPPVQAVSGLERWGILDETRRRVVREQGLNTVVRPLVAQLLEGAPTGHDRRVVA